MSWPLPGEPALDVDEIQGHVLVGFGGAPQAIGAFTATAPQAVARVLSTWARNGVITSTRALLPRKGLRAKPLVAKLGPWVAAAVSVHLLKEIGAPANFFDPWLINPGGMRDVSSALNDPDNPWVVGGRDGLVDVVIIAAAADAETAVELVTSFGREAQGAVAAGPFVEPLVPLPGGVEHFGFTDGLSQPAILGTVDGRLFEPRQPDAGCPVPYASPGQELIWPGHFVFGYPNRNPDNARVMGPVTNAGDGATSEFARNGSLLVYRRLQQDVAGFRAFCAAFAPPGVDPQRLQARIVGRWPSGLPIAETPVDPPPPHFDPVYNDFTFLGDRMQHRCPLSAHIRKVNPRLGGSDLDNVVPRLLRRGVPFGSKYEEGEQVAPPGGRGLAFLAYQASIRHQFGAIITEWVNNSTAPNNGGGHDFLIGQIPDPVSAQRIFVVPPQIGDAHRSWVTPTGGAFLLAPSISALRDLDGYSRNRHS